MATKNISKYHYVYITVNLKNGKKYIGDHSTYNLNDGYLGSGRPLFERAKKKYGVENFKKEILEFFDSKEEAFKAQEKYIKKYNTLTPNGYNISPTGGHYLNGSMSESTKRKIGEANKKSLKGKKQSPKIIEKRANKLKGRISKLKGKKRNPEAVINAANSNRGKKRTNIQRKRMSKSQQNRKPMSQEAKEKIRVSKQYKKLSDNHRKNISESLKGRTASNKGIPHSQETKNKISNTEKGKKTSEDTKRKMSIASKGKPKTPMHKQKCRKARLGKKSPRVTCEYCGKDVATSIYARFHGKRCKYKE